MAKKAVKKADAAEEKVFVSPLDRATNECYVIGIPGSPLVINQFNVKARVEMLFKHIGIDFAKFAKNPWFDGVLSGYAIDDTANMALKGQWWGMPTMMFKKGCIGACTHLNGITKTKVAAGLHINSEFVRIEGPAPYIREDAVKIGSWANQTTDLRYRLSFPTWYAKLSITVVKSVIDIESVINLLNHAGTFCGAGENRPEKHGEWGQYQVATLKQIQEIYKLQPAEPRPTEQIEKFAGAFEVWKTRLMDAVKMFVSKTVGLTDQEKADKLEYAALLITNPYQYTKQSA